MKRRLLLIVALHVGIVWTAPEASAQERIRVRNASEAP